MSNFCCASSPYCVHLRPWLALQFDPAPCPGPVPPWCRVPLHLQLFGSSRPARGWWWVGVTATIDGVDFVRSVCGWEMSDRSSLLVWHPPLFVTLHCPGCLHFSSRRCLPKPYPLHSGPSYRCSLLVHHYWCHFCPCRPPCGGPTSSLRC
jgi:hypothetical protein